MNEQQNPEQQNVPADQPESSSSHVTAVPDSMPDENYDPRIRTQLSNEPDVVHSPHRPENVSTVVSEKNQKLHDESVQKYPTLNLSQNEFVILDIKRHPIGLLLPVLTTALALLAVIAALIMYPSQPDTTLLPLPTYGQILLPLLLLMVLVAIGGSVAVWVYLQNHFYMTNESVIQEIQHSLFSRHEQTVSLGSIEDASFKQNGPLQMLLDYGTVRLSTEGEETTYRFSYVANPRNHIAVLNNAIESFKNGRVVDPYES